MNAADAYFEEFRDLLISLDIEEIFDIDNLLAGGFPSPAEVMDKILQFFLLGAEDYLSLLAFFIAVIMFSVLIREVNEDLELPVNITAAAVIVLAVLNAGFFGDEGLLRGIDTVSVFVKAFVPIFAAVVALCGNLTMSGVYGAAALFPVYSAFVNAVYPETTELYDGNFEYNNTPEGYQNLAKKKTDIFIGVYPSEEQMVYAKSYGTTYEYTPIGAEAFVFFVHKDNPIDNLTTEQIRGIYSGEITNWKQVGGKNEEIAAFQRNEGSGSQSMLERFMGDKPIMEAPTELVNDLMSGIIEEVSNYKSKSNSIGFSFRYYVEGIINNPDIKMLSVDGIAPTAENIKNGSYPIVTPIYAVTYEENTNENVDRLLDWILSEEGQYIIEETGYVGVASDSLE